MQKSVHSPQQKALQGLLKRMRKEAGFTQARLASMLNVPQSRISDIERGESLPDILVLRQLVAAMGVSLPDFVARLESTLSIAERRDSAGIEG